MRMFKKLIISSLLIFSTVVFFSSCGEESKTLDRELFGFEYFPLEVGKFWVYRFDETLVRNQGGMLDQSVRFVKEEISDMFVDAVGDTVYTLQISQSETLDGNFQVTDVWTSKLDENVVQRVEENLRFVKLIFPFNVGTTWEGNLFDELTFVNVAEESVWVYKDWGDYEVVAKGISLQVEGENYEEVASVEQADFTSEIERRYAIEHYAPGVGLIKKEMVILDTQCTCPGETWIEKAEAGFTLTQTLVDHN